MKRHEIEFEVQLGGKVKVTVDGTDPHICRNLKDFFVRVLQTTDEDEFARLELPASLSGVTIGHEHRRLRAHRHE